MFPQDGIIVLSADRPVYLSFLFIVQKFWLIAKLLLFMHLFIGFLHLEICF